MARPKNIAAVVIVFLIALFALLSVWTVVRSGRQSGQSAARTAAGQSAPGQASTGAQSTGGQGGASGAQSGSAQSGRTGAAPSNGQGAPSGAQTAGGARTTGQAGGARAGTQRTAVAVRAVPITIGTVSNFVSVSGDVLAARQVSIYPQTGGRITELRFRVGDSIRSGDVAARIDPSRPGEVYSSSPVVSTITGTILQAPYSAGDTVSTQSAIYAVGDLSTLVVETSIPERFSTAVRLGLLASAVFEAMPGETFPMEVSEISPVLDTGSRTMRIRLRFPGRSDPRIRAGMFATISLVTASHTNVPLIPRTCLINTYGQWVVFQVDDKNIAHRRVVTIGLENETDVEITSGLEADERVVSVGQNFLSEGETVRIVE